jgi:tetratricopeptide (TPR) repeat protein
MKKYSIVGYPTFIALNSKGETISRWAGYDRTGWLANADDAVKDPTTLAQKAERFKTKPTEKDAITIAHYDDSMGKYAEAIGGYKKAAELSGGKSNYDSEIFEATFTGFEEKSFPIDNVVDAAKTLFANEKDPGELLVPARMMTYAGVESGQPEIAVPFVQSAIEKTENTTDADVMTQRKKLLPDYALLVLKDKDKAVAYKKDSLGEGWTDRSSDLNRFAWWCFENKINLDEAYTMAGKGVQLAKPGTEKAQILDTMAEICNAKDDCPNAVKLTQQAIQEDPNNKHYVEQLKRFQDLAAKQTPANGGK